MSGLASVHSRPSVAAFGTSCWRPGTFFVAKLWRELFRDFVSSCRPELHYMRGSDPRWREMHGAVALHLGDVGRGHRLIGGESEYFVSEGAQPAEMNERVAVRSPEHSEMPGCMSRKAGTPGGIVLGCGPVEAREIVEARRLLIAELEQRRRLPCDCAWST